MEAGMSVIRHILKEKGTEVWSVLPQSTIFEALKLMAEKNVGALVVSENNDIVGIFSERDFARQSILHEDFSNSIPVGELMTKTVVCIGPDQTIESCMEIMTEKRIRHLPVMENDQLAGIISVGDVMNAMVSEQKDTINQLGKFISGRSYGAGL